MSHLCNQNVINVSAPNLSFAEPEYYGCGISVKQIDFEANMTRPPFKATYFEVLPGYATPVDEHKVEECWMCSKEVEFCNMKGVVCLLPSKIFCTLVHIKDIRLKIMGRNPCSSVRFIGR